VAPGLELESALGLAAFLTYLVCALALAGLASHRSKMAQWRLANYDVATGVTDEWRRSGVDAALLTLVLAALLVASHMLDACRVFAAWLWDALLLPLLRLLPWGWLNLPTPHLCPSGGCGHTGSSAPAQPPPPMLRASPQRSTGILVLLGDLWDVLTRAVLALAGQWPLLLCLVALLALARVYAASGRSKGAWRLWRATWSTLGRCVRLLYALLFGRTGSVRAIAGALATRGPARARSAMRRFRSPALDDLPARQAVVALYLAALRNAARRGFARGAAQTPGEYARQLAEQVPEAGGAAKDLTETFVVARYGAEPIEAVQVERARTLWQRLRLALRSRRRRADRPRTGTLP
jgi:hypothetical protein